jgi:hypothetical protein
MSYRMRTRYLDSVDFSITRSLRAACSVGDGLALWRPQAYAFGLTNALKGLEMETGV